MFGNRSCSHGYLIVLVFAMTPPVARAQDGRATIEWSVPPELDCMDAARLAEEVDARLGRPRDLDIDLAVRGRAERTTSGGVRAVFVLRSGDGARIGTRTIETDGQSCRDLDEALPIVVAMMLNVPREELTLFLPRIETARPEATELDVDAAPLVDDATAGRGRDAEESFRGGNETSASISVLAGVLPDVAVGVRAAAAAVVESRSVVVLDAVFAPEAIRNIALGVIAFRLISVGLATCALGGPVASWLRLEACVGARVGAVWAEPSGFDENRPDLGWLVEIEVGGRAAIAVAAPAWVTFGLAGTVPIAPTVFVYQGPGGEITEIHRLSPVTGRLDLGIALRFE